METNSGNLPQPVPICILRGRVSQLNPALKDKTSPGNQLAPDIHCLCHLSAGPTGSPPHSWGIYRDYWNQTAWSSGSAASP